MSQQPLDDSPLEGTLPVRIGAGSFATVFATPGRSLVIKVVHAVENTSQVEKEFNSLHSVYTQCNSDSIFAIPRALAFYDPQTQNLLFFPPSPGLGRRRDPRRPFNPEFFANLPARACYVMDRAAPLPLHIAQVIRPKFYSEAAIASGAAVPLMCRLYFGKELRPSIFFNPNNFPIDVARYDLLCMERQGELISKEEVAAGMGEMLSRIHWNAGYDARDIEFVMAGSPDAATVRLYVIDFNQMRPFEKNSGDVTQLADAFFSNDPYYPRPAQSLPLYTVFRDAYISSCPSEFRARAALFLQTIESQVMFQIHRYNFDIFHKGYLLSQDILCLSTDPLETCYEQVTYIWNAPWTIVKATLLLNRYGNLIGQTYVLLEETDLLSHGSQKYCAAFWIYCALFAVFSGESIRILVLIRAWAIWRCKRNIGVLLLSFYLVYIIAVTVMIAYGAEAAYASEFPYVGQVGLCIGPMSPNAWKFYFPTLSLDGFALAIVCYSLFQLSKEPSGFHPSPLIRLLVRDAFLFYFASLFNGVFSIICWTAYRQDPRNFLQTLFSFPLVSIVGQRLVLNVRGLRTRPATSDWNREVDRQVAAMGCIEQSWDLEGNDETAERQSLDDRDAEGVSG